MVPLRRRPAWHLLGAWLLYWVALAAVVFWRPAMVARRISRLPQGRSNAAVSFGDGGFDIKMMVDQASVYHGHASYGAVVLWLVVPPLLLWLVWLTTRPRPEPATPAERAQLGAVDPLTGYRERDSARQRRDDPRR